MLFVDAAACAGDRLRVGLPDPADPTTFVTRRTLRLTADGGASWQTVQPPSNGSVFTYRLADPTTVIAVSDTTVLRTQDNGATWQAVPLPAGVSVLSGFRPFSAQRFVLADAFGKAWLSTDGGASWNLRSAGGVAQATLNSIWFFDSREGMAIADDGSSVRSSDGGKTWAAAESDTFAWYRLQFLGDGSVGWLISLRGTIARSVDKGHSWTLPSGAVERIARPASPTSTSSTRSTAGRSRPSAAAWGRCSPRVDGGLSWQAVAATRSTQGFYAIRFADAMHGVTVGPTGVAMVTGDGGATWAPRSTGAFGQLFSVVLCRRDHRGRGRRRRRSSSARPMPARPGSRSRARRRATSTTCASSRRGSAMRSATRARCSRTRDGGATWSLVPTGAKAGLGAVFFLDEQTGWISGTNGSILATATGGL